MYKTIYDAFNNCDGLIVDNIRLQISHWHAFYYRLANQVYVQAVKKISPKSFSHIRHAFLYEMHALLREGQLMTDVVHMIRTAKLGH